MMQSQKAYLIAIASALTGCSQMPFGETLTQDGVTYSVQRVPSDNRAKVPQNADLKMADGDVAKYAISKCSLDANPTFAPVGCDVFVQSDKSGTLIGYAFLIKDNGGVSITTDIVLNDQKQPGGASCGIQGPIENAAKPNARIDPSKDFQGRFMYSAVRQPENILVSPYDASTDIGADAEIGVWYISKTGDKLRISQERWNYCYDRDDVIVDDVFYRVASIKRQ